MDTRAIEISNMIEQFRSNPALRYAAKHYLESDIGFTGICQCDQYRNGELISGGYPETHNIFTTEGLAYLLNIIFFTTAKAASLIWYVNIFKNNVTPAVSDVASTALGATGTYLACQNADYDSPATNSPSYTTATTAIATITNAVAGAASFTMAASITVYGALLTDIQAKSGTSGHLMCAKAFSASRAVIDNDVLAVTYAISCTSS
jgi:hypothetical protein